jgi:hypothetical protein
VTPPSDTTEVIGRGVDQFIAQVLGRAHQAAMAVSAPDAARAILTVAEAFADELAAADSHFDRLAFLVAVTEER